MITPAIASVPVRGRRVSPLLFFFSAGAALISAILPAGARAEVPNIGVLVPLSGQFAELGEQCRWGVEAARTSFVAAKGAATPAFVYEDSQADPKVAISGIRRLIDDKKVAAVILIRSPVGLAVNPVSAQSRTPLLGAVAHPKFVSGNSFAFQMWASTDIEGATIANGMASLAGKRAAIVTAEDDWLIDLSAKAREKYTALGGKVVIEESVRPTDPDLSPTLTKVKAANVDAAFLDLTVPQIGLAVKRLRELGYTGAIFSNFWASMPDVQKSAGEQGMNGVYFPEMETEQEKFRAEVEKDFPGKRPTAATFSCYTSTSAVLSAVSQLGGSAGKEALYERLVAMRSVRLLDGNFTVKDRVGQYSVLLKQIREGKVQLAAGPK